MYDMYENTYTRYVQDGLDKQHIYNAHVIYSLTSQINSGFYKRFHRRVSERENMAFRLNCLLAITIIQKGSRV